MLISVFDIFSIGIGPSSSHTVGPMRAAKEFVANLKDVLPQVTKIEIILYGSLAFTGRGHGSDKAIIMGLLGETPETINPNDVAPLMHAVQTQQSILLNHQHSIHFNPETHIIFNYLERLTYHSNGMKFIAYNQDNQPIQTEIYYSIGGGFIVNDSQRNPVNHEQSPTVFPYPFESSADILGHCANNQISMSQMMPENEKIWRSESEIGKGVLHIAEVMEACIHQGCHNTGILEGGLHVRRRAPPLFEKLCALGKLDRNHPQVMSWLNCYAMAVNEENAAGGKVVTAPTNGAAGIIPAVLQYYKDFCHGTEQGVIDFLLTAAAIGILYKKNASISDAEMGCQGEVGVACSMAAGALAAVLGGSIYQVENAAEIGMEHNLGLTCDPVGGLVQIPCIERNAMGAVKAVNAAQLALSEDGQHKVSLDMVINTMREIGTNMNSIYKETSKGGLAVNVPEC